jgi:hypothetical protein
MLTDKERIEEIIKVKQLNNVEFCNQTALSPSSLSHILSGRTKPTISTLRNIVEAFPDLNPMWVLLGQGEMYAASPSSGEQLSGSSSADDSNDLFAPLRNTTTSSKPASAPQQSLSSGEDPKSTSVQQPPIINVEEVVALTLAKLQKPQRKVTEVRIFFDDGTFEAFTAN